MTSTSTPAYFAERNAKAASLISNAIALVPEVDALVSAGRNAEAAGLLFELDVEVRSILGGNAEVCTLLDQWDREFGQRYVKHYDALYK